MNASLVLKPGREKSILRRHPWVFSGAVREVRGNPEPGETVEILGSGGERLGLGACSPRSQIVARLWTTEPGERVDRDFFHRRLSGALALRRALPCRGGRT
ncbi:MAG TPA: hypothetical protein PKW20_02600, partial [Syntrophales bacterium]|nr:hypothetical protein [Syntrophales bacterium]